ncbi:MAG: phosphate signaling complex protein PhoU [Actinomycetota bacterium]
MEEARKRFQDALADVRADVQRAAAATGEAVAGATHALLDRDLTLVDQVLEHDRAVDELSLSIETQAYRLIGLQQPVAHDLRTLLAVLRILQEIGLSADLAVTIAKAARRLYPTELHPRLRGIIDRMGEQATVQFRVAMDAFADEDATKADVLSDMDDVMDDLQKELFHAIFALCQVDEAGIQQAVQVALVGRYYERIADHAVLVGKWVNFMATGELPEPPSRQHEPAAE